MKEFTPERQRIETATALEVVRSAGAVECHGAYVGLDVHKEAIVVAVAEPGRGEPQSRGEIANKPKAVEKLLVKLSQAYGGEPLLFCYEAGPCGYGLYRQILAFGHDCQVVAPSLIPRAPGERVKTDRRDAKKLARLLRGGDLTAVWVPDEEQERMRDLSRARDDMKSQERKARQTKHLQGKARNASAAAKAIAWKAQTRLCGRYRLLSQAGKNTKLVCVAIARELAGFIWDIVRLEMPALVGQAA